MKIIFTLLILYATLVSADSYNSNWQYRKLLTIVNTIIFGTLTNFAWLIPMTNDPDLSSHASNNGYDLLFTLADGTNKLKHEIESYSNNGTLYAWVKIPVLSSSTNTNPYMYYGNSSVSDQSDKTNVWDDSYKGVWHLGDGDSTAADFYKDSAGSAHGTLNDGNGNSIAGTGKIDGGYDFNGDADFISIANFSQNVTTAMTISGWVNSAGGIGQDDFDGFFGFRSTAEMSYVLRIMDLTDLQMRFRNSVPVMYTANIISAISPGTWVYVSLTYDGDTLISYVNGAVGNSNTAATGVFATSILPFEIGCDGLGINELEGIVDEVRVSDIARSPNWIKTSYTNQFLASGGISTGSETALPVHLYVTKTGDDGFGNASFGRPYLTIGYTPGVSSNDATISDWTLLTFLTKYAILAGYKTDLFNNFDYGINSLSIGLQIKIRIFEITVAYIPFSTYINGGNISIKYVYDDVYIRISDYQIEDLTFKKNLAESRPALGHKDWIYAEALLTEDLFRYPGNDTLLSLFTKVKNRRKT